MIQAKNEFNCKGKMCFTWYMMDILLIIEVLPLGKKMRGTVG